MRDVARFIEYARAADWRFLQERKVGLDLYYSGWLGLAAVAFAVVSATVFVLALFHIVPRVRHIVLLLLGAGSVACACGVAASWWNWTALEGRTAELIHASAGPSPVSTAQEAAVISLPALIGAATLVADLAGCLYLAVFWSRQLFPGKKQSEASSSKKSAGSSGK
jgi:hypothetical protein